MITTDDFGDSDRLMSQENIGSDKTQSFSNLRLVTTIGSIPEILDVLISSKRAFPNVGTYER